jgi:hypothetical protein
VRLHGPSAAEPLVSSSPIPPQMAPSVPSNVNIPPTTATSVSTGTGTPAGQWIAQPSHQNAPRPLLQCRYEGCNKAFRLPSALMKHLETVHRALMPRQPLKRTFPVAPPAVVKRLPPLTPKVEIQEQRIANVQIGPKCKPIAPAVVPRDSSIVTGHGVVISRVVRPQPKPQPVPAVQPQPAPVLPPPAPVQPQPPQPARPYTCPECRARMDCVTLLARHVRKAHNFAISIRNPYFDTLKVRESWTGFHSVADVDFRHEYEKIRSIDYRCDDGDKSCQVVVTSWHHWKAGGSRISKMPLTLLKSQLFIRKVKEPSRLDRQILTPTTLKSPFLFDLSTTQEV